MKNFVSVSTNAARIQDISLNPQKLAGMCAKLKCCLNYEVDDYVEASRKMPSRDIVLQTADSDYYQFKSDILAGLVTYSTDKGVAANLETISADRARTIIEMNKRGEKPESLTEDGKAKAPERPADLLADADISRFDKAKKKKKKQKKQPGKDNTQNAAQTKTANQPRRDGDSRDRNQQRQPRRDNRQKQKPQGNGAQKPQPQDSAQINNQQNAEPKQ